jgi:signal transduction histidine kinase/CheY-like chemotaxis protein
MTPLSILAWILVAALSAAVAVMGLRVRRSRRTVDRLERQIAEAESRQARDDLRLSQRSQLDTMKDEFISTVSHELRTPLTSIRGALGLLSAGLMGPLDAKAHNLLRIAVTNTDRLIRLINDILDLERMESGRAPLQLRRCSLTDLVNQAVETMSAMADSAHVRILFRPSLPPLAETEPRLQSLDMAEAHPYAIRRRRADRPQSGPDPAYFDGDPDRILQVLTNLLSNAIKFSPIDSTVVVTLQAAPELLRLSVSDRGRGIPDDKLETIFDRFQQVEPTDSRQKGGTGLGLAICRSIVQQHGGTIWAQRNPEAGVSLCIDLPRINRASDHVPGAFPELASHLSRSEGAIIVCDDDPGVRTVVAEQLRRRGYIVLETSSGEETLATAAAHQVDAILLDLYMPGLSGWKTLERLRQDPVTADIPVVILSVLSSAQRSSIAPDAQGWVQKPFHEDMLFGELVRVLEKPDGPGHVLLIEDDQDLADIVIDGFHDTHLRIEHAATRNDAMDRCLHSRPDLLILDLTLPDGDGFSLVDWLRTQPTLRALPLVVYSGREVSNEQRASLRLGPTQFLTKAQVQPREVEALVLSMVHHLRFPA